jgi:hypothetical protein
MDPSLGQSSNIDDLNPIESMPEPIPRPQPTPGLLPGQETKAMGESPEERDIDAEPLEQPGQDRAVRQSRDGHERKGRKTREDIEEQQKLNTLRQDFHRSLAKLTETDTREVGLQELQRIIRENATPAALRVYLGLLTEGHKQISTNGKELQVLVLGYIAKIYQRNLLDPLDKPPNLIKSIARVIEIIHKYMHVRQIFYSLGKFLHHPQRLRPQSREAVREVCSRGGFGGETCAVLCATRIVDQWRH